MVRLDAELDAYEQACARRVGEDRARGMRAEMAEHLAAAYEARIEVGESARAARAGALASVGHLGRAARGERRDVRDVALRAAPWLGLLGLPALMNAFYNHEGLPGWAWLSLLPGWGAALVSGFGRDRARVRSLVKGGLLAFALPGVLIAFTQDGGRNALLFLLVGFCLVLLPVLWHGLGVRLGRVPGVLEAARGAFWARTLALSYIFLVSNLVMIPKFLPGNGIALLESMTIVVLTLFIVGMRDRRRFDLRAGGLGVLIAVGAGLASAFVADRLGGFEGGLAAANYRLLAWFALVGSVQGTLVGQGLGLGFWWLVRRGASRVGRIA